MRVDTEYWWNSTDMGYANDWQSTRWRQVVKLFSSRVRNHLYERLAYIRFHSRTFLWADLTWSCVAAVLVLAFPHLPTDASVTVSKSNFIHSVTISHLELQYIHRYLLSSVACGVLSIAGRSPLPPAAQQHPSLAVVGLWLVPHGWSNLPVWIPPRWAREPLRIAMSYSWAHNNKISLSLPTF